MFLLPSSAHSDVVKPALIEIGVYSTGAVRIEIRTSIEALLSGIDGRYRNTQDAPTAAQYDELRVLPAADLATAFKEFHRRFSGDITLQVDAKEIPLSIDRIEIPEPGYTKVPRTSIIYLEATISTMSEVLTWYYPASFGDQAVRVKLIDEPNGKWHWSSYQWIREDKFSDPFPLKQAFSTPSKLDVLQVYTEAGYRHILPLGLDHIFFVLGLCLLSCKYKPLLWQVTMFTLAHSVTLSLSIFEIINIPSAIVEPLIALSIAFIAIENLMDQTLKYWRLWIVFGFGLLHGLGFANMLDEFGMPETDFVLALLGFNLGVEFGQLTILLLAWYGVANWFKNNASYRKLITIPGSIIIAVTSLVWFWQRLVWFS